MTGSIQPWIAFSWQTARMGLMCQSKNRLNVKAYHTFQVFFFIWNKNFKPFYIFISLHCCVLLCVCYIKSQWKTQKFVAVTYKVWKSWKHVCVCETTFYVVFPAHICLRVFICTSCLQRCDFIPSFIFLSLQPSVHMGTRHIAIHHLEREERELWVICELLFDWWANQRHTKDFINERHPATNQQSSTRAPLSTLISAQRHTQIPKRKRKKNTHTHTNTHFHSQLVLYCLPRPLLSSANVWHRELWSYHKVSSNTETISSGSTGVTLGAESKASERWCFLRTFGLLLNHFAFVKERGSLTVSRKYRNQTGRTTLFPFFFSSKLVFRPHEPLCSVVISSLFKKKEGVTAA